MRFVVLILQINEDMMKINEDMIILCTFLDKMW